MGRPDVLAIETAGLRAWPAHETARDRSWVLRASGGHSKRANSVQSLDPHDNDDAATRLEAAARWLVARNLPAVARVTPLAGADLVEALDQAGWAPFEPSLVLTAELKTLSYAVDGRIEVSPPAGDEWLAVQHRLQNYDEHRLWCVRGIVRQMEPPALGLVLRDADGAAAASAYIAVVDGVAFMGNVVTATAQRRRGFGRRLVQSALALATEAGATFATLQMLKSNAAAFELYTGLGYRLHYEYHHRRPATP